MAGEGENNGTQNNGLENQGPGAVGSNPNPGATPPPSNPPVPPSPPVQKFPEPVVLDAVVNPEEKPKTGSTPFSFSTPKKVHEAQAIPTKGDVARASEPAAPAKPKLTLADIDKEIANDEKAGKERTIDDYVDTATMFIEGWEALLTFAARMISKDHTDSTYEFGVAKKERLIHQATKVSRKRDWVMPIEYLFVGTLLPASAAILLKAQDKRKEYMAKMKDAPEGSEEALNKGGPNKGFPKRRSPGRPRK